MLGSEFRQIRKNLGLSEARFAELLGYTGKPVNNRTRIQEMERGKKPIPLYIARLAWLIDEVDAYCDVMPEEVWPTFVNDDGAVDFSKMEGGGDDGLREGET